VRGGGLRRQRRSRRPRLSRRPAAVLTGSVAAGIDVGGTKVLGVTIDATGNVLHSVRVPTPPGGASLVDVLAQVVSELAGAGAEIGSLGVGLPGLVDRDGVLRSGPHLPEARELAVAELLAGRVGLPVVAGNDATMATIAEHRLGAARGYGEALLLTLGTGIGGGLVSAGAVVLGANGFAGEVGHMTVVPDGRPCPCGQRGCWERYGSGSGLALLAAEAGTGWTRGEEVTAAAASGDATAIELLHRFAGWVALGIANLVLVLDPGVVVIGGGLVEAGMLLLDPVRDRLRTRMPAAALWPTVPILPAELGDRAGAIGAALAGSAPR
jgi:glucokinase